MKLADTCHMAWQVEFNPRAHRKEERKQCHKVVPDLHVPGYPYMYTHTHACEHTCALTWKLKG